MKITFDTQKELEKLNKKLCCIKSVIAYEDINAFPDSGKEGVLYIAKDTNNLYYWDGTQYVGIEGSLPDDVVFNSVTTDLLSADDITTDNLIFSSNTATVTVDIVSGNDSLPDTDYPTARFRTLDKAFDWISRCSYQRASVYIIGSSIMNYATLNSSRAIYGKYIEINSSYIRFNQTLEVWHSVLKMLSCTIDAPNRPALQAISSYIYLQDGSLTLKYATGEAIGLQLGAKLSIRGPYTINYTANNQALIYNLMSYYGDIDFVGSSTITCNTGAYTGCKIIASTQHPVVVRLSQNNILNLNGAEMGAAVVQRGVEGFSLGGYDSSDWGRNNVLYNLETNLSIKKIGFFSNDEDAMHAGLIEGDIYYNTTVGALSIVI